MSTPAYFRETQVGTEHARVQTQCAPVILLSRQIVACGQTHIAKFVVVEYNVGFQGDVFLELLLRAFVISAFRIQQPQIKCTKGRLGSASAAAVSSLAAFS